MEKNTLNTITIQLAGHTVQLVSQYRFSPTIYSDFRTDMPGELSVELNEEDVDFNSLRFDIKNKAAIKFPCILRKVTDALLFYDVLLMHGVALAYAGMSYLFTAPCRTGKTTHAALWLDHVPEAYIINGDKPFLKFTNGGNVFSCGSPWAGKERMYTNTIVPLKSIILMERSEDNHIEQISFAEAFPFLLQQVYRPDNEEKMRRTLRLMQQMNGNISFWRFQCNNFKSDCFATAYNALVRDLP